MVVIWGSEAPTCYGAKKVGEHVDIWRVLRIHVFAVLVILRDTLLYILALCKSDFHEMRPTLASLLVNQPSHDGVGIINA